MNIPSSLRRKELIPASAGDKCKGVIEIFNRYLKLLFIVSVLFMFQFLLSQNSYAQSSLYEFQDFTVKAEKFPPGMNPYVSVEINLDGTGTFTKRVKGRKIELEKRKNFKVTANQLEFLYYQIMRARFFEMGKVFGNPNIDEGTIVRVSVKIDKQLHTVTMFDERYIAVDEVIEAILSLTPPNLRKEYETDLMDFSEVKLP